MRISAVWLIASAAIFGLSGGCMAAGNEFFLYRGAPVSASGITLGSWGSGKAVESSERVLSGSRSIRVTTEGLYAGGRIDFAQPVSLFTGGVNRKQYIVFSLFFPDTKTVNPAAGTIYAFDIPAYVTPKATRLRCVFVSDTGLSAAAEAPIGEVDPDDNWVRIAIPIAKLNLPEDMSEFKIKRLVITCDAPGSATSPAGMFVGEIKSVEDDEPIKIEPLSSQMVIITEDVFLVGNATGGVSSLEYTWDWDASNGIQEESTGRVGRFVYTKGGEYTVTLTVKDVDGLKKPASVTTKVSVNE